VSEETTPQAQSHEDDVNTTPPNPPAKDGKAGWSMPEPVFKKTSGYLPQGYENLFPKASVDANSTVEMPAADVEPQPQIADHAEDAIPANGAVAAASKKSSGLKMVLMILGVLFAIALVVVFIAVIYILFMMPVPSGPFE
jgi:hypothetical protein